MKKDDLDSEDDPGGLLGGDIVTLDLDVALDFNDYPKLTASSDKGARKVVITSKKRGGVINVIGERNIAPNWDEGIISITCCWYTPLKKIGAIVNLIPRKRQLMRGFLVGNKRSKLYKNALMREIFSLFVAVYGGIPKLRETVIEPYLGDDNVLIDPLDEGVTFMKHKEAKNKLFHILDDLFEKNDEKIIDELSGIYQEAMKLGLNQSYLDCIESNPSCSLGERKEWRSFIQHSNNQFFRLENIVREFLIKNGFSKLPKKDDIIDSWIKKYPSELETKPDLTDKGSSDWSHSKAFEDRGNAAHGTCKAMLESWGFLWLQEDAPDMEGNVLREEFLHIID